MPKQPSARAFNRTATLVVTQWGKDVAGGRQIVSTQEISGIPCQWEPGQSSTQVDETGRWTSEQDHTFRFRYDVGLKPHDQVVMSDGGVAHHCIVTKTQNAVGRNVYYEVAALERT